MGWIVRRAARGGWAELTWPGAGVTAAAGAPPVSLLVGGGIDGKGSIERARWWVHFDRSPRRPRGPRAGGSRAGERPRPPRPAVLSNSRGPELSTFNSACPGEERKEQAANYCAYDVGRSARPGEPRSAIGHAGPPPGAARRGHHVLRRSYRPVQFTPPHSRVLFPATRCRASCPGYQLTVCVLRTPRNNHVKPVLPLMCFRFPVRLTRDRTQGGSARACTPDERNRTKPATITRHATGLGARYLTASIFPGGRTG